MPAATEAQIRDLANTIALQADALAQGKVDPATLYAHIRRLSENARTLEVWTADLAPAPVAQGKSSVPVLPRQAYDDAHRRTLGTYQPGSITAGLPALDEDLKDC